MTDFVLIAGGAALLAVAVSFVPPRDPEKTHFLDRVENPRIRRVAGFAVGVISATCGLLGLILLGAALVE